MSDAMNCQAVQNKILSLPDPRHIPDALRAHVVGCSGCRVWAEQAGRLESLLERLPTPPAPTEKKNELIAELHRHPRTVEPAAPQSGSFREWLARNGTLVGGLAAALMVAVGGWWMFSGKGVKEMAQEGTPRDPFLEKMVQRDVALAKAASPTQKLQVLGGFADDLSTEARGLARIASPDELKDVARWFDRVVKDGMVKQAEKMNGFSITPAERKEQLTQLARKLGETAEEVKKATGEVPPEAKPILERIVDTARYGQKKLQDMAG